MAARASSYPTIPFIETAQGLAPGDHPVPIAMAARTPSSDRFVSNLTDQVDGAAEPARNQRRSHAQHKTV